MKVLMCTSEWPSAENPHAAIFVVRQVEFLRARGIDVKVFHFRGSGNPLNYLRARKGFKKVEDEFQPDIVHAQWGQSVIPTLPKSRPLVITYRGDDLEGVINANGEYGLKSHVLKRVGKFVARFADQIAVVSPHLIPKLKTGVPIHVIPSGLDFSVMPLGSKQEAKKSLGLSDSKKYILFPNNPKDPRKNMRLIQEVLDMLNEEERKDLELRIVFGVSHQEILLNLKAADLLIFTSLHEGSPNVVKEALANDVAIVSVPVGDVPYRIAHIPGCFLSSSYEPDDLLIALRKALNYNYSNYESRSYVEDLNENLLVDKLVDIYKQIVQ